MGEISTDRKFISNFNPVISSNPEEWQDYLDMFNAGKGNSSFTEFLKKREYVDYCKSGDGATYVLKNIGGINGDNNTDIIGFFTLSANSIPYKSIIKDEEMGTIDEELWGIPVAEIKLFAIDERYQDHYTKLEGNSVPVAVVCLGIIISVAEEMISNSIGFKALFLHSVPEAEHFYLKNGFSEVEKTMIPLTDIDSEFKPLWMPLRKINDLVFNAL